MKLKIHGGWFDPNNHEYTDENGRFVPSLTQILALAKYSNFDGIPAAVVENAACRGTNCHFLTECYDRDGEMPPPWTPQEELVRFRGYEQWKERERFIPEIIEHPMIGEIYGMKFGCTIDRVGMLAGRKALVELKFTYAPSKSWGIQLAAQEMIYTGSPTLGRYLRVVCHVDSKGVGRTILHRDPQDGQRFIFALGSVWTRIDLGQDVRREVLEIEEE